MTRYVFTKCRMWWCVEHDALIRDDECPCPVYSPSYCTRLCKPRRLGYLRRK